MYDWVAQQNLQETEYLEKNNKYFMPKDHFENVLSKLSACRLEYNK